MSKSRRRSKTRTQGRERCPKCGSKSVHMLNKSKDQLILECKRPSCQAKWHIPKDMPNMRMRLSGKDIKYEEIKKELPKEDKEEIVGRIHHLVDKPAASSLLDIGPDGSIRLKQNN